MEPVKNPMETALKYLSRQSYTEQKLSSRLHAADFNEDEIAECISRLKGWGYLNDREYGISRIKKLLERLKSRSYIKLDLENSALPQSLASELLDIYYPEEIEVQIARKLLQRKTSMGKFSETKLRAYLLRAGFSENTVHLCFPGLDPT